jgi:16S rRNA (adenine1518-N6/adenine1519-N6)-dimethyltransferase
VAAALRSLGVRPNRRLGQNFLIDPRVAERIAALVEDPREPVLEIGPGLGSLTTLLARSGRPLVAVELDMRLAEAVERALAAHPNARVVRGDILKQQIEGLFAGVATGSAQGSTAGGVTVVGNLPYSITTPALEWILTQGPWVRRALLMVQREYARRLAAPPGGKEFGSISIFVGLHAEVSTLFNVSRGAFHPRPEVDSVMLELKPRPYPGTTPAERIAVERLARAGMGTRRKTLLNSLARGLGMTVLEARGLLASAGIDSSRRAETLGIDDWLAVARRWPTPASGAGAVR